MWTYGFGCSFENKNEQDATLTLRRSCREGICGSCAMNWWKKHIGLFMSYRSRRIQRLESLPITTHVRCQRFSSRFDSFL